MLTSCIPHTVRRRESLSLTIHPSGGLPEEYRVRGEPSYITISPASTQSDMWFAVICPMLTWRVGLQCRACPPSAWDQALGEITSNLYQRAWPTGFSSAPGKEHVPLSPPTLPGWPTESLDWAAGDHAPLPCPIDSLAGYAAFFTATPCHPTLRLSLPPPHLRYPEAAARLGEPTSLCLPLASKVPRERDGALSTRPEDPGHASQSWLSPGAGAVWGGAVGICCLERATSCAPPSGPSLPLVALQTAAASAQAH